MLNMKPGDTIQYRKVKGTVLSFYRNTDKTYTLNILGKVYSDSWTHLTESDLDDIIKVL